MGSRSDGRHRGVISDCRAAGAQVIHRLLRSAYSAVVGNRVQLAWHAVQWGVRGGRFALTRGATRWTTVDDARCAVDACPGRRCPIGGSRRLVGGSRLHDRGRAGARCMAVKPNGLAELHDVRFVGEPSMAQRCASLNRVDG
jgi:hypothetical protein